MFDSSEIPSPIEDEVSLLFDSYLGLHYQFRSLPIDLAVGGVFWGCTEPIRHYSTPLSILRRLHWEGFEDLVGGVEVAVGYSVVL